MRLAEDKLDALEKLIDQHPVLLILTLVTINTVLLFISKPYEIALNSAQNSRIEKVLVITLPLFFMILGMVYLGIKGKLHRIITLLWLMLFIPPLLLLYYSVNGGFDTSQPHVIAGEITKIKCGRGSCSIEFEHKNKRLNIAPASKRDAFIGKEIVVTYKDGLLGRAWVLDYKVSGASS